MTLDIIRKDLKDIRYYYSRKSIFEEACKIVGDSDVLSKATKYNDAIKLAPPRLYDLYVCLYIKNYTQEGLSIELNYTTEYIQMQNKKLLLFLQKELTKYGGKI
ncbi:hypothetical protein EOM82_08505 [bacterium]|nr:hypothetical protein [bacterium]